MAHFLEANERGEICGFVEVNDLIGDTLRIYVENPRYIEHEAVDPALYYVQDGRVSKRPSMPLTVSGFVVAGIPPGAAISLGEQTFEVNDGKAEIAGYSGKVKIACWPYVSMEVVV